MNSNAKMRSSAIGLLRKVKAKEAIPRITLLLQDSNSGVRSDAIICIRGSTGRKAVPRFIRF